nr:immunoglobulin light chain junction region [Macaca mulatta]
CQQYDDFLPTF